MGTFSDRGGSSSCVAGLVIVGIGLFGLGLATGMFFPWTGVDSDTGEERGNDNGVGTSSLPPIPIGTPKLLISSTGIANEYKGTYLGLYELQKETYKNHSVYKLKHTTEVEYNRYLYTNGIFWKTSEDIGSTTSGELHSLAEPGNPMPPRTGWLFYAGKKSGNLPDPKLKVEPVVEDPWCSTITVTATGRASVKKHTLLGPYKRTEFWSSGKPVYQLADGAHFLLNHPNKLGWSIRSSMEISAIAEVFTGTGTICPADPRAKKSEYQNHSNWKYHNGTEWVEGEFTLIDNCHPKEHN